MAPLSTTSTILVVAEESDTRIFLSNLLGTGGFLPVCAAGISDGLRIARTHRPDLIILDVMMANKEGIRIYHHIKNDPGLRTVPVIMLSAIDRETFYLYEKFRSTPAGSRLPAPDAFLEKPPEGDDLIRLVLALTAGKKREKGDLAVSDTVKTE